MQSRWKDTVKPVPCGKLRTSFSLSLCSTNGTSRDSSIRPPGDRALIQAVRRHVVPSSNPEPVHVRYEVDEVALVAGFSPSLSFHRCPRHLHRTVTKIQYDEAWDYSKQCSHFDKHCPKKYFHFDFLSIHHAVNLESNNYSGNF